jgi:hypothetical protein
MQQKRAVIIRCRWESYPAGWPEPPLIPDGTLLEMFSRSPGLWSVAQLWHQATLGEIDFDPAVIVDIGALVGKGFDGSLDSDGNVRTPVRVDVLDTAIAQAQKQGFSFAVSDVPVVMIAPPPSPAGAIEGRGCVLDVHGGQSYMAHELGHALGFNHSWGLDSLNRDWEYGDPYCLMSALIFGSSSPDANGLPVGEPIPAGLPAGWTDQMGPLPAAGVVWRYNIDFATCPAVAHLSQSDLLNETTVTLTSFGAATSQSNVVLAVVDVQPWPPLSALALPIEWCVEYRGTHGWDRGIGPDSPPPGIVIHRINAAGNVVQIGAISTRPNAGRGWHVPDDALAMTVRVVGIAQDERSAQVKFGLHAWSVRRTLAWAGLNLGGNGLRSLRDPIPSLQRYLDALLA